MTKEIITLLLLLLPLILITACQQQTPVSSEQKANVKSSEVTMIQSDSSSKSGTGLQEQDDEKKADMDDKLHDSSNIQPKRLREPIPLADSKIRFKAIVEDYAISEDNKLYQIEYDADTTQVQLYKVLDDVKSIASRHGEKPSDGFDVIAKNGDAFAISSGNPDDVLKLEQVAHGMNDIKKVFDRNLVIKEDNSLWLLALKDNNTTDYPISSKDYTWTKVMDQAEYAAWAYSNRLLVESKSHDLWLIDYDDIGDTEKYQLVDKNIKSIDAATNSSGISMYVIAYIDQNKTLKKYSYNSWVDTEEFIFSKVEEDVRKVLCTDFPTPTILYQLEDGQWIYEKNNDSLTKSNIDLNSAQQYSLCSGGYSRPELNKVYQYQILFSIDKNGQLHNKLIYSQALPFIL